MHQDRAISAHGQRGAQLLLAIGRPNRCHDHFVGLPSLLDSQRLLKRNLIKWIDAHFDALEHYARAVGFDLDANVVVHYPLDTNQ